MEKGNTKQEILEAALDLFSVHGFEATSISQIASAVGKLPLTPDAAVQMIQGQIRYILHEPYISKARKMLVIEQFRNTELAKLQTKQNYSDIMRYFTGLVKHMIQNGVLTEEDPEIMAAQLCLPISTWINLCDREPERESEVMEMVDKHIRQFFRCYQSEAR